MQPPVAPVLTNNSQKPEPPKNKTGPAPNQPPAPTNNSKPEPPKNVTVPPAPVAPAKNGTKPETPPAPVEPNKNASGPAPQPPAKNTTNTTALPKKSVDYTAYRKAAREDAKREWKDTAKQVDNNGDGRITFNELLLAYAR